MLSRYWIDFSKWEVFVNDDHTRTFLSLEVITGGLLEVCFIHLLCILPFLLSLYTMDVCKPWMLAITSIGRIIGSSFMLSNDFKCWLCLTSFQITKQIQVVNEVYRLHNLPEFYKVPLLAPSVFCKVFLLLSWSSTICSASFML